ncbi:hypothetical protein LR48_Vigan11g116000 [Vigna angularis]|uniref:Putative plant transposon protein domain-containing protein n=1 Tax=Phaseolus angularis TaxID=3914 RepID=A0A0L9VSS1_PHAAN|nr:hypothetical protein LR48_Vigan11g116000 [Vigna angularis]
MKRVVDQLPMEAPEFAEEVWCWHWSILTTFPSPANIAVVREFYANAQIYSDEEESFMSYVSGRQEVEHTLCLPRGQFQRNRQGQPLHIKRSFLTPLSKYWVAFIHANISPCSKVSNLTSSRAMLLFFILQGQSINVGQIIAHEINDCAQSTISKAPFGHPSLISHLCEFAGIDISTPPFERPHKTINRLYYLQYCLIDEEGQPIPAPQQPHNHLDPPVQPDQLGPHDPYHMFDMRMTLIDAKLEAVNQIGQAHADMMRHVYASSHPGFMTPEDYAARVAWPGDQAHFSGGGGTSSGVHAMEEDQSDDGEEEEESDDKETKDSDS